MRPRVAIAAAGAVAIVAALGACSKNTGDDGTAQSDIKHQEGGIGTAADSKGPAPAVKGAKKGGTINLIQEKDFEHLDPARIYVNNAQVFGRLFQRQLTTFVDDDQGNSKLVGDLATDPGKDVNGDCKVWQYTLKDGLKYEDGSPIVAKDIAYGVARTFSPDLSEGPDYIQQWLSDDLAFNTKYKGPYNGGSDMPPGVTVKGDKQITFTFKQPHCDMPFASSWGTTTPVPKAQDKKAQYDNRPFSSGPYKFDSYLRGTKAVLSRNKYWDPNTDPLRHNYADKFEVEIGPTGVDQTNRMIADNGKDQYGIMQANVDGTLIKKVQSDASLKPRVLSGYTQFTWYLAINNLRIKDLNVRKALNYAMDKKAYIQAFGGSAKGEPASTIESPTTIGFKHYDAYPLDVAKAKKLLNGKHPKLVYAYANTETGQKYATVIKNSLEKAGFQIVLKAIDGANYYTEIGKKDNSYDLYESGWGSDWPSALTIIPPLFDGGTIQPQGNYNSSYTDIDDVNKRIAEVSKEDASKAAEAWMALDKELMTKYAPVVPLYYQKEYTLVGSKVGGCALGVSSGWPELTNVYAK
ncbi:MAG: ABC transporter substrate-binding protein [Actinocatenispora sp.]